MSIIETLITDRTQADVDALKKVLQKPEHLWDDDDRKIFFGESPYFMCIDGPLECLDGFLTVPAVQVVRGAYNASDLNRVGEAAEYLRVLLRGLGYAADIAPKADWSPNDYPTPSAMETYLQNIRILRRQLILLITTPAVPESMEQLTFTAANDIEKILVDLDSSISTLKKTPVPCGAATCGGDYL